MRCRERPRKSLTGPGCAGSLWGLLESSLPSLRHRWTLSAGLAGEERGLLSGSPAEGRLSVLLRALWYDAPTPRGSLGLLLSPWNMEQPHSQASMHSFIWNFPPTQSPGLPPCQAQASLPSAFLFSLGPRC